MKKLQKSDFLVNAVGLILPLLTIDCRLPFRLNIPVTHIIIS
jgi:hypothetical protein